MPRRSRLVSALTRRASIRWAESAAAVGHAGLAVRRLGSAGRPVVLIHGLFGSSRYFGAAYDPLATGARLVLPDLPGFGASAAVAGGGLDAHADAVAACLRALRLEEPAVVVGHSLGSLVGLGLAARHPELVAALVALGPPVYRDRDAALAHLGRIGLTVRLVVRGSPAFRACYSALRGVPPGIAALTRPDLPPGVGREVFRAALPVQASAIADVLLAGTPDLLLGAPVPVSVLYGEHDLIPDRDLLGELAARRAGMTVVEVPGTDHHLPLQQAPVCSAAIQAAIAGGLPPAPRSAAPAPVLAGAASRLCQVEP
jgi:3-oxoadipate enol-lactonase